MSSGPCYCGENKNFVAEKILSNKIFGFEKPITTKISTKWVPSRAKLASLSKVRVTEIPEWDSV